MDDRDWVWVAQILADDAVGDVGSRDGMWRLIARSRNN